MCKKKKYPLKSSKKAINNSIRKGILFIRQNMNKKDWCLLQGIENDFKIGNDNNQ